jgi:hypothetical protein
MQAQVVNHDILLMYSAFDHRENFTGKTIRELLELQTFLVAATAVADDQVDVIRRDVAAADIAVIIAFAVERADNVVRHDSLIYKNRRVDQTMVKPEAEVVTSHLASPHDQEE